MRPDDIYLAKFPFGGSVGMKLRPVLLLTAPIGAVPEVVVAYLSSVIPNVLLPTDILLDPLRSEHASSGLKVPSVLRLHKLATIHKSVIVRQLGVVPATIATEIDQKLRELLAV